MGPSPYPPPGVWGSKNVLPFSKDLFMPINRGPCTDSYLIKISLGKKWISENWGTLMSLTSKKQAFLGSDAAVLPCGPPIQKPVEFKSYRAGWCAISGKVVQWYHYVLSHSIVYTEASKNRNLRVYDQSGQFWIQRKQWRELWNIQD